MHSSVVGARWVIGVPFSLSALREHRCADGEDVVIYDALQAGSRSLIGFTEGTEAAAPFHPERKPVDAYCACLIDSLALSHQRSAVSQ
jgi:ethanolamine utilization protein EutN